MGVHLPESRGWVASREAQLPPTASLGRPSDDPPAAMDHDEILSQNRQAYNRMAAAEDPLCRPATDEELADPLRVVDAAGWLGKSIQGRKVLCLAAGGGRQSSLYAAAGAEVTVVDLSGSMLELDRRVAAERGYSLRLVETSMEDLSMFESHEFDIVIQPVSSCYVPAIVPVYLQVARVLSSGGIYVSQHKQPGSLQASIDPLAEGGYRIQHRYYRDSAVPAPKTRNPAARRLREPGAIEFLHRWEELIGGLCRAGFVIEDLTEPVHARNGAQPGTFADRASYLAPYVRIKARRAGAISGVANPTPQLWLPSN